MKITKTTTDSPLFEQQFGELLAGIDEPDQQVLSSVRKIISDIRQNGDAALVDYTNRFDHRNTSSADLEIPKVDLQSAVTSISPVIKSALEESAERIRDYHERQKQDSWLYKDKHGNTLGQQVVPLDRVGVYVPGGKAAYPSSVLMNVIPAKVAGVREIMMTVPCPGGEVNPLVLAAAVIAGVDRVFGIGGAQAIAALAYGTETIPQVDKIVGPGNIYVATAKRLVFGNVGIDMIAGPSEVLVIADDNSNPDWIAMDLFAQAEHDEDARAILICPDQELLDKVEVSIGNLLPKMERAEIISKSLEKNGVMIKTRDLEEAIELANRLAPEHLQLVMQKPEDYLSRIRHAGAIFMGYYSAEVLGDYCAGPNHVLPTSRTARFSSPLGVYDFQKRSSVIQCTEESVNSLAGIASVLARGEGLTAHARSAEYRLKK